MQSPELRCKNKKNSIPAVPSNMTPGFEGAQAVDSSVLHFKVQTPSCQLVVEGLRRMSQICANPDKWTVSVSCTLQIAIVVFLFSCTASLLATAICQTACTNGGL